MLFGLEPGDVGVTGIPQHLLGGGAECLADLDGVEDDGAAAATRRACRRPARRLRRHPSILTPIRRRRWLGRGVRVRRSGGRRFGGPAEVEIVGRRGPLPYSHVRSTAYNPAAAMADRSPGRGGSHRPAGECSGVSRRCQLGHRRVGRAAVLEEVQGTPGFQNPADLGERRPQVGNAAERVGRQGGVDRSSGSSSRSPFDPTRVKDTGDVAGGDSANRQATSEGSTASTRRTSAG